MSSISLRFNDHAEFHRAALHMAGAGAAAGVAGHLITSGVTSPIGVALVGAAAVLAAMVPGSRTGRNLAARGVLVALAGGALALGPRLGGTEVGLGLFGAAMAAAFAWGARGRNLLLAVAGGGVVAVLAHHALTSVATARELSAMPAWLGASIAGTSFAFVSALAVLPRHLRLAHDRVGQRYRELQPRLDGEVRELVDRGHALWTTCADSLPEGDAHRETLEEGVLRLLDTASRWRDADAAAADGSAVSLTERIARLDERIEASTDAVARDQYGQARAALAQQLDYLDSIGQSRERVLARMHNYLAAMERLRLAVIKRDTATASLTPDDVAPLVGDVESLGRDIDACADVLGEM